MAAVPVDLAGSWFSPLGVVGFFVLLLLLSVFLTALCSKCSRRTFELQKSESDKTPPALISVVKLEESRENPTINQIPNDEKEFPTEDEGIQITPWRSHLGALHSNTGSCSEEEGPVPVVTWRSHLGAPPSTDASHPRDSAYVTQEGRGNEESTNHVNAFNTESLYARINKKSTPTLPVGNGGMMDGGTAGTR